MQNLESRVTKNLYIISFAVCALVLMSNYLFYQIPAAVVINTAVLVCLAAYNIITVFRKLRLLIVPINFFSLVWLMMIPLTSFPAPMMEAMSQFQWSCYLIGCMAFCIGGAVSSLYAKHFLSDKTSYIDEWKMKNTLYMVCMVIIIFSILCYILQAYIAGGFQIFAKSGGEKASYHFRGLAFFSNMGILPAYLVYCDKEYRKKKLFIFTAVVYLIVQLLMAIRFLVVLILIMILSTFTNELREKKQIRKIIGIAALIILVFVIVTAIRGGNDDKQKYFINTGLYQGTSQELVRTEFLRYFGMSQRTMEAYMQAYEPGCTHGALTLSPLYSLLGIDYYNPDRFGIYGYTATNIITNLYFDFGDIWWIAMAAWGYVMNIWYYSYKHAPNRIMRKYLWCLSATSITLSYYCYINSIVYWYCHYIIILALLMCIKGNVRLTFRKTT